MNQNLFIIGPVASGKIKMILKKKREYYKKFLNGIELLKNL